MNTVMPIAAEHLRRYGEASVIGSVAREYLGFTTVRRKMLGEYYIDVLPKTLTISGMFCGVSYDEKTDVFNFSVEQIKC